MNKETSTPPQSSLFLRLLGGGYLLYLACDLRAATQDEPLFWIAIAVFGIVGAALLFFSIRKLIRKEFTKNVPESKTETNEDCEERTDE